MESPQIACLEFFSLILELRARSTLVGTMKKSSKLTSGKEKAGDEICSFGVVPQAQGVQVLQKRKNNLSLKEESIGLI